MDWQHQRTMVLNTLLRTVFVFTFVFTAVVAPLQKASAAPSSQSTGGLQVNGAILDLSATPGMDYVHHMSISVGPQAPAMEVTVEAMGFGQALDGTFEPVPPAEDKNPYSALTYITSISKPSFHINPGESVAVDASLKIPATLGMDTRYAAIYIKGTPTNSGNVTQILAVFVPVVITPQGAALKKTAAISEFVVDPIEAGKPIRFSTTVKNTGNHHFRVKGDINISDPAGKSIADLPLSMAGNSIVPTFSETLVASYSALEKNGGLQPGTYTAEVKITLEDGTPLDSKKTQFEISQTYRPFPEIDEQHIQINCYKDEEPGTIDARQKADIMVSFEGVGKVTGCVAIGKFSQEPAGTPRFTDPLDNGGAGSTAIKFFGIQTQGFSVGKAVISGQYAANELNGINPNSLLLAYRGGDVWKKLDGLAVQTGAGLVVGGMQVSELAAGPVIAMGSGEASQAAGASIFSNPWLVGGIGAGAVLIIVLIGVIWSMAARNRRTSNQPVANRR
jgi:hypothetical protein